MSALETIRGLPVPEGVIDQRKTGLTWNQVENIMLNGDYIFTARLMVGDVPLNCIVKVNYGEEKQRIVLRISDGHVSRYGSNLNGDKLYHALYEIEDAMKQLPDYAPEEQRIQAQWGVGAGYVVLKMSSEKRELPIRAVTDFADHIEQTNLGVRLIAHK